MGEHRGRAAWRAVVLAAAVSIVPVAAYGGVSPARAEAARLLTQATFGTTIAEIKRVTTLGNAAWVDDQLARPPTYHYPVWITRSIDTDAYGQMQGVWFQEAVEAPDQLRQRVAFALSEMMVVSAYSDIDTHGLVTYYDLLLKNAFGNFRDLMQDVTLSMAMGRYLSMYQNRKPDTQQGIRADENFARESMQLFTIGLVKLNLDGSAKLNGQGKTIPTYTQADIENLARIFTGWASGNTTDFYFYPPDWTVPMKSFEAYHDRKAKTFLGHDFVAARSAPIELNAALDILFKHPNVGPFVSRQLIQHLVTSNPTPAYIARVAAVFNDDGAGVRGNLSAVVRAILLDDEARTGNKTLPDRFGKMREPVLRLTHLWRAFGAKGQAADGAYPSMYWQDGLGQAPLSSASVFNFFSPFYSPDGELRTLGLVAPEMQLANDSSINRLANTIEWPLWIFTSNPYITPDPDNPFVAINLDSQAALAVHVDALFDNLSLLLMSGQMPPAMRTALARRMDDYQFQFDAYAGFWRAKEAIYLIMNSPQYLVQK